MDHDTRAWLINFVVEDIPSMSPAEILHRIAALREDAGTGYFPYPIPVGAEERGMGRHEGDGSRGYTSLHINLLLEELKGRGHF